MSVITKLNIAGLCTVRQSVLLKKNYFCFINRGKPIQAVCQRYNSSSSIHDAGNKVYTAPLSSRIRSVKLFSLGTSALGLMSQPILVQKVMAEGFTASVLFAGVIFQFFTLVTPVLLHLITKKYVREIYYNPKTDEFTALTYSFFAVDKLLSFKAEEVVAPDVPGMFTSIIVKGTPLFIDANYFHDISHYKRIMGFDKPIDFKLEDQPPKT